MDSRALAAVAAAALVASLAGAGPAEAQRPKRFKKAKPACDLAYLPFTPGARWTYAFFMTGDVPPGVYVKDPETFTVKVLDIATAGAESVIKLEESYRKVVVNTEIKCGKAGVTVPPESFFFFGEPGGGQAMQLADLKRDGQPELPAGRALKAGEERYEELKATAIRTAADGTGAVLPKASLELERKIVIGGREDVESKIGSHDSSRVDLELTGRSNLEGQPKEKEFNMPGLKSVMWFSPGLGVVRVESSAGKGWQLSEYDDGSGAPPMGAPAAAPAGAAPAP